MTEFAERTSLVVLQPTAFCNINCAYCYLPNRSDRTRLEIDRLRALVQRLFTFPTLRDGTTFVWHAGEPLVLGPQYYEAAFSAIEAERPMDLAVDHAIQTNGMLIDDAWCDLFRRWNVGIGVSIDGPRAIHDANRKTRSGKGTFDKAIAGIERLRANDIPFHVISVLGHEGLRNPDALFAFYRDHDIRNVGFNVEEVEGVHASANLNGDVDAPVLRDFLRRFSQMMVQQDFAIEVRELEHAAWTIRTARDEVLANEQVQPFGIITIDVTGEVYTFSPELAGYSSADFRTFSIGNIFEHDFDALAGSDILRRMNRQIAEGVALCRERCRYFRLCGGGAPSNKVFENGTFASAETTFCRLTKKTVMDFVLDTIESSDQAAAGTACAEGG
jgi:uncharacterized protein